jgi:septal ring factor EnvC (AmiA/AmiB activator)
MFKHYRSCAILFLLLANNSGCVIRDIRDELITSNASLEQTSLELRQSNDRLKSIDAHLESIDHQLAAIQSLDTSLRALEEHLLSLRKTLENVDARIPFVTFAEPTPETTPDP